MLTFHINLTSRPFHITPHHTIFASFRQETEEFQKGKSIKRKRTRKGTIRKRIQFAERVPNPLFSAN
jgi:hypothetical protein